MQKITVEKKKLKKIIGDLVKARYIFEDFGFLIWDRLSENEEKQYSEAEGLLIPSITKLKKIRKYKKKTIKKS